MSRSLLFNHEQHGTSIFDANTDHCLAYWLDSDNIDHYHIHMIETCACVVLVLIILVYLQCKRWNVKKLYVLSPMISSSAAFGEDIVSVLSTNNQQPLLKSQQQPTYDTTNTEPSNLRPTV